MSTTPAAGDPLVVVGMSVSYDGGRLLALAERLGASAAHLQLGEPSLRRELDRLADAGETRVVLVGAAFGSAPGNSWLRRAAAHWWRERTDPPELVVASGQLDDEEDDLAPLLVRARSVTGTEAGLSSAAWEDVPRHARHVFVCRGPRCTARGAEQSVAAMVRALDAACLGDDDVLLTQTGCLFPCNHAPVVVVHPDDVWYGAVEDEVARAIVDRHLVSGEPVAEHRLPRDPR